MSDRNHAEIAPETRAEHMARLRQEEYELLAKEALSGLETLTHDEKHAILSMRIRQALESFIDRRGNGDEWAKLHMLMIGIQDNNNQKRHSAAAEAGKRLNAKLGTVKP